MDKSYRIHTNIISDTLLKVNMQQDFDFLEILSLKLRQKDAYRLHSSNYGVIIGRVLANDAFGIPNAKISIFIERDKNDTSDMEAIYPYSEVTSKDKEGRRYNLLPDYSDDDCYRVVGTFPNKRLMLDDNIQLEVYDKYYKYTTVTNNAGDYMIFGVPTGSVTVHVEIDLSDIGILSQKPRDFEYKGYNLTMFDSPNQFKESTNLDGLAQIFSQNRSVFVYPFWGDADNGIASLTRADIQIQYKFEPTCVFIGSIISDNEGHSIGHKCAPDIENGMNDQLVGGSGTIEMIRRTTDGLVEEYQIQGNQLINDDGVWCYQIPMNLDYIGTDEYGNVIPTDNPTKGIPTRTQVRFRISKNETNDEGFSRHTAKYLVPMNPIFAESGTIIGGLGTWSNDGIVPVINTSGQDIEKMYNFGSATPDHCFRDLYWNNVYSVKNYIPKVQVAHRPYSKNYGALKGSNLAEDQNPIPFNKLRVDLPFVYILICILVYMLMTIVYVINALLCVIYTIINTINKILKIVKKIPVVGTIIPTLDWLLKYVACIALSAGLTEGNTAFYPGCWCGGYGKCPEEMEGDCKKQGVGSGTEYMDRIQRNLAQEFKIIKLDLYQDWINGTLYMPLWYWRKRKKRSFWFDIFGWFKSSAKNDFCSCETSSYSRLKTYVTCEIPYKNISLEVDGSKASEKEKRWHKNRAEQVRYRRGLIRPFVNKDDLTVYYYAALQATSDNANAKQTLAERPENFYAIRLYATDIILLGNLLENNLYGIPQFFKCLPSTTANIPAIATIEEEEGEDEKDNDEAQYESSTDSEESGNTVVTGMDWRRDSISENDSPKYRQGLFMNLGCTFVDTKAKSCINVERLSELGVALDSSYTMRYAHNQNAQIKSGQIKADGFISKLELDDMENRAMFATMNHIGFIPQSYQQSISAYTTQVPDENTNYLIPKFKYIYPVDFDGRQQVFMTRYRNGFKQPLYDEKDDNSYITFRLGAEKSHNFEENSERRVRHFYKVPTSIDPNCTAGNDAYYMPLYNNSFYFYFGIKKGSTAIDKFNEMFYAECFQNDKKPFSMFLDTRPRSYCPEAYDNPLDGYAFIRVNTDDIRLPYSYTLYDENDILVISESGMTKHDFIIGGHFEEGTSKPQANPNGTIYYQTSSAQTVDVKPYDVSGLTNQLYYLTLTDADGRSITERISLDMPKINGEYKTTHLSAKFYSSAATRIDYICHEDNHFYGIIDITGFTCDGYDCIIDDAVYLNHSNESGYTICITGHSDVSSSVVAYFSIKSMEWDEDHKDREVSNCMCDVANDIATVQNASGNMKIDEERTVKKMKEVFLGMDWNTYTYDESGNRTGHDEAKGRKVSFFVYQPNSFATTIIQGCPDCSHLALENTSSTVITIYNADNFNTFLNDMPTVFMIGSVNDSVNASVANGHYGTISKFYSLTPITSPINGGTDKYITGWFGAHQESSYMFSIEPNDASDKNKRLWEDYIRVNDDIHMQGMKRNIIEMKFNSMFALSEAVYIRNEGQNNFEFTATGGTQPLLVRSIAPYYDDESKFLAENGGQSYLFKDNGMVVFPTNYPNIVGLNASGHTQVSTKETKVADPEFSLLYMDGSKNNGHRGLIGNYFAGFTHNGGYVPGAKNKLRAKPSILRQPNFASISPYQENILKYLGVDDERPRVENFNKVYKQDEQDLRPYGDSKKRTVNPWLRALNVDRRYDYDLTVLGPVIGENFRLHLEDNKERPWKSLRISGFTYNGIEMSYDDEYNIISATTVSENEEGDVTNQKANKRLEYSYYYSDQDRYEHIDSNDRQVGISPYMSTPDEYNEPKYMEAVTLYNHEKNQVWSKMHDIIYKGNHFGFDGGSVDKIDENYQIIKEPYVNEFAGFDLRNFYWSMFNKERLTLYIRQLTNNAQVNSYGEDAFCNLDNPFYVFQYPHKSIYWEKLYNYDFNRKDVLEKKTYPTKRFIDIGNIYPSLQYLFTNEGCAYGMKVSKDNDGFVKCKAQSKEETNFNLNFIQPVNFVAPNATNKEFGNIVFIRSECGDGEGSCDFETSGCEGWKRFNAKYANLNFNYNLKDDTPFQDFDIYTKVPKLIKVLPYIPYNNPPYTDGLTFIKSANPLVEIGRGNEPESGDTGIPRYADGLSLDEAIDITEFYTFGTPMWSLFNLTGGDTFLPQGVDVDGGFQTKMKKDVPGKFFWKEGKPLNSNDNDFANIRFFKEKIDLKPGNSTKKTYAFTMLIDREYVYKDDDTLTRHIRLIEFPEIYDCRHLLVRSISVSDSGEVDDQGQPLIISYVEYKGIETETPVTEPTGSATTEGHTDTGTGESSYTTEVKTQERDASGHGKVYTQVLSFEMRFLKEGEPEIIQNYAFADYKNMGYIFEFLDTYNNKYFVEDGVEVSYHEEGDWIHLRFTVKWDQNMGILQEPKWTNDGEYPVRMAIYAKTPSNFTYKVFNGDTYLLITLASQDPLPEKEGIKSKTVFCIK